MHADDDDDDDANSTGGVATQNNAPGNVTGSDNIGWQPQANLLAVGCCRCCCFAGAKLMSNMSWRSEWRGVAGANALNEI